MVGRAEGFVYVKMTQPLLCPCEVEEGINTRGYSLVIHDTLTGLRRRKL